MHELIHTETLVTANRRVQIRSRGGNPRVPQTKRGFHFITFQRWRMFYGNSLRSLCTMLFSFAYVCRNTSSRTHTGILKGIGTHKVLISRRSLFILMCCFTRAKNWPEDGKVRKCQKNKGPWSYLTHYSQRIFRSVVICNSLAPCYTEQIITDNSGTKGDGGGLQSGLQVNGKCREC